MADTRDLTVVIKGNTSGFTSAMKEVTGVANQGNIAFGRMTAAVAAGNVVFSVASRAFASMAGLIKSSSQQAATQELAVARLSTGIQNVTSATDKHIGALLDQAQALQATTRFSDDQVISAQGMLSTFQLNQTAIAALTPRLIDMSEGLAHVTGEMPDLESNANLVAKALGGEDTESLVGALRRANVMMTDQQKKTLEYGNLQQRLGAITEALDSNFKGLGETAGRTTAGRMAQLQHATDDVKKKFGELENQILTGISPALTNLVAKHGDTIISLGLAGAAVLGFAVTIAAAAKIIGIFTTFGLGPLSIALTAIALLLGAVVYKASEKLQKQMMSTTDSFKAAGSGLGNTIPQGASKAQTAMADLGKQLAKLDAQINQSNQDFMESMADMIKSHQDKAKAIKSQVDDENSSFADSQKSAGDDWKASQAQMVNDHEDRVNKIQQQIDMETAHGSLADRTRLQSLQQELAIENNSYTNHFDAQRQKYEDDVARAKEEHQKKLDDLQKQLDDETSLLQKHASDVAAVRSVDLLDEIDKLKQSHQQQLNSFEEQKSDLITNANQTTAGIEGAFGKLPGDIQSQLSSAMGVTGNTLGNAMGNAMKDALKSAVVDVGKGIANWAGKVATFVARGFTDAKDKNGNYPSFSQIWQEAENDPAWRFRAAGGPVSAGQSYVVGEQGMEMFVPKVAGDIVPNHELAASSGDTVNITVNMGMYAGMPVEKREIALSIYQELVRAARANGVRLPIIPAAGIQ